MAVRRNGIIAGGWGDYWLDPTDAKEFGPNAKYLDLNMAEAKKLLTAAGQPNGFDLDLNFAGRGSTARIYQSGGAIRRHVHQRWSQGQAVSRDAE